MLTRLAWDGNARSSWLPRIASSAAEQDECADCDVLHGSPSQAAAADLKLGKEREHAVGARPASAVARHRRKGADVPERVDHARLRDVIALVVVRAAALDAQTPLLQTALRARLGVDRRLARRPVAERAARRRPGVLLFGGVFGSVAPSIEGLPSTSATRARRTAPRRALAVVRRRARSTIHGLRRRRRPSSAKELGVGGPAAGNQEEDDQSTNRKGPHCGGENDYRFA